MQSRYIVLALLFIAGLAFFLVTDSSEESSSWVSLSSVEQLIESKTGLVLMTPVKNVSQLLNETRPLKYEKFYLEFYRTRWDFVPEGSICQILAGRMGLKQVTSPQDSDIAWVMSINLPGTSYEKYIQRYMLPDHTITNSLFKMRELLGSKTAFSMSVENCIRVYGEDNCDFAPRSYAMPAQLDQFESACKSLSPDDRAWAVKMDGTWSSRGVEVVTGCDAIIRNAKSVVPTVTSSRSPPRTYMVQRYISKPYLWNSRKFDLRVWVVITSVYPLRVFVGNDHFAKIASSPYDASFAALTDECVQFTSPKIVCDVGAVMDFPSRTLDPRWRPNLTGTLSGYKPLLDWDKVLVPNINRAVLKTVLSNYATIKSNEMEARGAGARGRRFAMLDIDVILMHDGTCFVEEVNTNGYHGFDEEGRVNGGRISMDYLENLFHIMGVPVYNDTRYQADLDTYIAEYCDILKANEFDITHACSYQNILDWKIAVHEIMAAEHFTQVFPPLSGPFRSDLAPFIIWDIYKFYRLFAETSLAHIVQDLYTESNRIDFQTNAAKLSRVTISKLNPDLNLLQWGALRFFAKNGLFDGRESVIGSS